MQVENSITGIVNGGAVQGLHFGPVEIGVADQPFVGIDYGSPAKSITFTPVDIDHKRVAAYYRGQDFLQGDEVVLREDPDAEVFTIIDLADDPASDGGQHYFARTESGGTVFLDPAKITAAPANRAPAFKAGDRVRVMTDEVPGSAPRGSTGTVRDVEHGFVYVRLDHSGIVFPLRAKELAALTDVPAYRKVLDHAELRNFPARTVLVYETPGTPYVKSFDGDWVCPGSEEYGPYNGAMWTLVTTGALLVVYVPPLTQH